MWFVYVLLCKDNSLYTGIALDPQKRFLEHKNGKGGAYTKAHKAEKIIYSEKVKNRSLALKREMEIKSWKRAEKIKILGIKLDSKRKIN